MTIDTSLDTSALDAAVVDLRRAAPGWVALPLAEKLALLDALKPRIAAEAAGMAAAAAAEKGIDPSSPWVAEEWLTGPWAFLQGVVSLSTVLHRVLDGQEPVKASAVHVRPDGRTVVEVFPVTATDKLLFSGYGAQVWLEPGVTPEQIRADAARAYRGAGYADPGVVLVLGAGNVGSIATLDILDVLYTKGDVALLKMNPVNDYLGPFYERIFADFVSRGWLRFCYGGADVGAYLAHHDGVDSVHMTGSAVTHDAIVWGVGEEAVRRRRDDDPLLTKPITSELGGVSPMIVVPGDWDEKDLRFQAENIVTSKMNNSGHNCIGTQVLVLSESWPLADALLDQVRAVLRELPPRPQYYPRARDKVTSAVAGHEVEAFGGDSCVMVAEVDLGADESLLRDEVFGGAFGVVRLPGATAAEFLAHAVTFANEVLPGTLGASVLIDPATAKAEKAALDAALTDLRYGTIGVNAWSALGFLLGYTPWGGHPGHTAQDIGSGVGFVHNAFMIDRIQKSVCWSPFRPSPRAVLKGELTMSPKPPYYVTSRTGLQSAKALVDYLSTGKVTKLPAIFAAALRG